MTRRLTTAAAVLTLATGFAACGKGPEDKAQDAGQNIGEAIAQLQTSQNATDAGKAIDTIVAQLADIKDELPSAYATQITTIGEDLKANVAGASADPAAIRQAFSDARDQLQQLNSSTNSVVNELRRGVREGYDDAMN